MPKELPSQFYDLVNELEVQYDAARELWLYAFVQMLIQDGRARVVKEFEENAKTHLLIETPNGEQFSIVRPEISPSMEKLLVQTLKASINDNSDD